MTETTIYNVQGMTCGHCVSAITDAVTAIGGVSAVTVDLGTGAVTVASDGPIDPASVQAAIDDAGYEVV